jgi:hypothetical protein
MPSSPLSEGDIEGLEPIEDVTLRSPKSVVISVRMTREELDEFSDAADEAGMKLSTFLKEVARDGIAVRRQRRMSAQFGMQDGSGYLIKGASTTTAGAGVAHGAEAEFGGGVSKAAMSLSS